MYQEQQIKTLKNKCIKIKHLILVFLYLSLNNQMFGQESSFVLFIAQKGDLFEESSIFLLNQIKENHSDIKYTQILPLDNQIFCVKFLLFPTQELELMACCEIDTISFYGIDQLSRLDSSLGKKKVDSLAHTYYFKHDRYIPNYETFKKQLHKSIKLKHNNTVMFIFEVKVEHCDCVTIYSDKTEMQPLGFETFLKKILSFENINKKTRQMFLQNENSMINQELINKIIVTQKKHGLF